MDKITPLKNTEQHFYNNEAKRIATHECDVYFWLNDNVNLLLTDSNIKGKEYLKKKYGDEKFKKKMFKVKLFNKEVSKAKTFFEVSKPRSFVYFDCKDKAFIEYQIAVGKMGIMNIEIYEIFYDLLELTDLGDKTIKSTFIDRIKRSYKEFKYDEIELPKEKERRGFLGDEE